MKDFDHFSAALRHPLGAPVHGSAPLEGELCSNTWTMNQVRILKVDGLGGEEVPTEQHW